MPWCAVEESRGSGIDEEDSISIPFASRAITRLKTGVPCRRLLRSLGTRDFSINGGLTLSLSSMKPALRLAALALVAFTSAR